HVLRSPLGRVMRAVKANERRAEACGYNTRRVRLVAFLISGFFSGLAGALLTVVLEFVPIENIHWPMSGTVLLMTLFGCSGTLPDGEPLLQALGLTKVFGGLTAVNRVDFAVQRGELRAVIGPNGAGKTTFFNVLTGVLPASHGRILFKGRDVTRLPTHAVSRL